MTSKLTGFKIPAEWEPQKSIWIAWPYNKNDWPDLFSFIPHVVAKIVKIISENQKVDLLIDKNKHQVLNILKNYSDYSFSSNLATETTLSSSETLKRVTP